MHRLLDYVYLAPCKGIKCAHAQITSRKSAVYENVRWQCGLHAASNSMYFKPHVSMQ